MLFRNKNAKRNVIEKSEKSNESSEPTKTNKANKKSEESAADNCENDFGYDGSINDFFRYVRDNKAQNNEDSFDSFDAIDYTIQGAESSCGDCAAKAEEYRDEMRKTKLLTAYLIPIFLSLVVIILSLISCDFAELYSRTVGGVIRKLLAVISGVFPFSVAETLIVSTVIFLIYGFSRQIYEAIKKVPNREDFSSLFERIIGVFVAVSFSLYGLGFAACNHRRSLADNLGLERNAVDATQLYECVLFLQDELQACIDNGIRYSSDGLSILPYSHEELVKRLDGAYDACYDAYPFLTEIHAPVKRIALSNLMTYTHISGIYIPYTGEANININYPDYVIAFSAAHEMAHQRGIAREDEANFMAFLVMYNSNDNYLRYAALSELYDSVSNALYEADEELLVKSLYTLPRKVLRERLGFSYFFETYSESTASKVADTVNDTSIKLRGDSNGSKSYDMMVDLAIAYFGF